MHLSLETLGAIHRASIEVTPVTVLVGPDHVSRTAAVRCLYALARRLSWDVAAVLAEPPPPSAASARVEHPALQERVERAASAAAAAIAGDAGGADLTFSFSRAELAGELEGAALLHLDAPAIAAALGVAPARVVEARAALAIDAAELADGCAHEVAIKVRRDVGSIFADFRGHRGRGRLSGRLLLGHAEHASAWGARLGQVLHDFVRWSWGTVLALPPERSAVACIFKQMGAGFEDLLGAPAMGFAALLRAAETIGSHDGAEPRPAEQAALLARVTRRVLADRVLRGHLGFTHAALGAAITWSPEVGVQLPLHAAPSMVGALAGLDIYLRYFAERGDLLIVEEPELGLHPAEIRAVTEALAMLAGQGIRVVISTHSLPLVVHLASLADPAADAGSFALGLEQARIARADLSIHKFDDGGHVCRADDPAEPPSIVECGLAAPDFPA
jgi:AAA domain, putative AbiEii toxin, Type IV TA system